MVIGCGLHITSLLTQCHEPNCLLRCWDPEQARKYSDIGAMQGQRSVYVHTQYAPNCEHLGEQSSMHLIANMRL